MVRRHRSGRSLRELRDEAAAAEALGLNTPAPAKPRAPRSSSPSSTSSESSARSRPASAPRQRLVWAVCDQGARTVATFPYNQKAEAEAHAASLQTKGKGRHFVRSVKEAMTPED